jgi:hypothetical protein
MQQEVLSQIIKRIPLCPASHHHGQVEELCCREGRSAAKCRTLPAEVSEQPRGEFTSANQVAERVMRRFKSAGHAQRFSLGLRNHYLTLPSWETPVQS